MRIKCPSCYAEFDLVAALDSEAGRELVLVFALQPRELSASLAAYLSLFRSPSRALSWDRALKLAQEVQVLAAQIAANNERRGIGIDAYLLSQALAKTVETLREKQAQGGWKPLSNHNYLKQVMQGISSSAAYSATPLPVASQPQPSRFTSQRAKALEGLDAFANEQ